MKRILSVTAVLLPTAALAHPGDHGGFDVGAMLTHLASEPDHIALALLVAAVGLGLTYRLRTRK